MTAYQKLAADLRKNGIAVEVFPEAKKMNQQYNVTEAKNVEWGILMNEEDVKNGTFTLKNLKTREMKEKLSVAEAVKIIGE